MYTINARMATISAIRKALRFIQKARAFLFCPLEWRANCQAFLKPELVRHFRSTPIGTAVFWPPGFGARLRFRQGKSKGSANGGQLTPSSFRKRLKPL